MLAEAYANTPVLPPVKKCPPGLPCGSPYVANSFLGMKKAAGGANSGTQAWEDVSTALTNREIWAAAVASLAKHDVDTLEFVTSEKARSLAAVGTAAGMSAEYARRKGGKRRLITANDNLLAALKKFAA